MYRSTLVKTLIVITSVLLSVILISQGCSKPFTKVQTNNSTVQPQLISRYTADQVISIVRSRYPTSFKRERTGATPEGMFLYTTIETPTQISVQFIGGSKNCWKAQVICPAGFHIAINDATTSITCYFWEIDGAIHQEYSP